MLPHGLHNAFTYEPPLVSTQASAFIFRAPILPDRIIYFDLLLGPSVFFALSGVTWTVSTPN